MTAAAASDSVAAAAGLDRRGGVETLESKFDHAEDELDEKVAASPAPSTSSTSLPEIEHDESTNPLVAPPVFFRLRRRLRVVFDDPKVDRTVPPTPSVRRSTSHYRQQMRHAQLESIEQSQRVRLRQFRTNVNEISSSSQDTPVLSSSDPCPSTTTSSTATRTPPCNNTQEATVAGVDAVGSVENEGSSTTTTTTTTDEDEYELKYFSKESGDDGVDDIDGDWLDADSELICNDFTHLKDDGQQVFIYLLTFTTLMLNNPSSPSLPFPYLMYFLILKQLGPGDGYRVEPPFQQQSSSGHDGADDDDDAYDAHESEGAGAGAGRSGEGGGDGGDDRLFGSTATLRRASVTWRRQRARGLFIRNGVLRVDMNTPISGSHSGANRSQARAPTRAEWERGLAVGSAIDARDKLRKWYESTIVAVRYFQLPGSTLAEEERRCEVLVHFLGWLPKFDEWVDRASDRIQPPYTEVGNWRAQIRVGHRLERKRPAQGGKWFHARVTEVKLTWLAMFPIRDDEVSLFVFHRIV